MLLYPQTAVSHQHILYIYNHTPTSWPQRNLLLLLLCCGTPLLRQDSLILQKRLQLSTLVHAHHDVAASYEFAFYVDLRDCWPVAVIDMWKLAFCFRCERRGSSHLYSLIPVRTFSSANTLTVLKSSTPFACRICTTARLKPHWKDTILNNSFTM